MVASLSSQQGVHTNVHSARASALNVACTFVAVHTEQSYSNTEAAIHLAELGRCFVPRFTVTRTFYNESCRTAFYLLVTDYRKFQVL